jgi:hypothetical protein
MDNALWKLTGFILAAVLMLWIPLVSMLERQDDIALSIVESEVTRFVDTARDMGKITPRLYNDFLARLEATGSRYDVRIRHQRSEIIPVYDTASGSLGFTGAWSDSRVTEGESLILSILYPDDRSIKLDDARRVYRMRSGDLLFLEVSNKGHTMAATLSMLFFKAADVPDIFVRAGGMVRNEAD